MCTKLMMIMNKIIMTSKINKINKINLHTDMIETIITEIKIRNIIKITKMDIMIIKNRETITRWIITIMTIKIKIKTMIRSKMMKEIKVIRGILKIQKIKIKTKKVNQTTIILNRIKTIIKM